MGDLLDLNHFLAEDPIEMLKFLVCVKGGLQSPPGLFYGLATAFKDLKSLHRYHYTSDYYTYHSIYSTCVFTVSIAITSVCNTSAPTLPASASTS